jgi:SAM-dependent methyltransferase
MENKAEANLGIREYYRKALGETFRHYLKPEMKNENIKILSVGCGFGYEAGALLNIFNSAKYVGIDNDEAVIEGARETNEDLDEASFIEGDATKKESFGDKSWDLIVVRNPQVLGYSGNPTKEWQSILNNCADALSAGGLIYISNSTKEEKDTALNVLSLSGKIKILLNQENESKVLKGTFKDDFIAIGRKD